MIFFSIFIHIFTTKIPFSPSMQTFKESLNEIFKVAYNLILYEYVSCIYD